jgi:uncharacterized membrane protein
MMDGFYRFQRLIAERHRNPFCVAFSLVFLAVLVAYVWRNSLLGIVMAMAATVAGPFLFEVPEQAPPVLEKLARVTNRWLDETRPAAMVLQLLLGMVIFVGWFYALWHNQLGASLAWGAGLLAFKLGLLACYMREPADVTAD